jgi:ribosomal protein L40E
LTRVRNSQERVRRKTVISADEFESMLKNANLIKDEFFRLRALAVLCLLRLTGKRREEIAKVQLDFVTLENGFLTITFELEKKKRRKKICDDCGAVNSKASSFCKKCGSNISKIEPRSNKKPDLSTKSIPLTDPLTQPISKYVNYLRNETMDPKFLFPRGKIIFGNYFLLQKQHLTGRQIFNIVRSISETIWPHLFRETVGSDVIKADPTIIGAFKVMNRLDLDNYETGFHYLKRYASDIIQREEGRTLD